MKSFANMPFLDPWSPHMLLWIYGMEEQGWHAQPMVWWPVSLFKHRRKIPVIVFHWPNTYWRTSDESKARFRAFLFRCMVRLAKALGYKLAWVVNNVLPHDAQHVALETAQRKWILRHFDLVIGYARNARQDLEALLGPLEIPYVEGVLGHYEGLYPASAGKAELVARFGLDGGKFRLLLVLSDRPYKGQTPFLEAWAMAETQGLQLVLAGRAAPAMDALVKSLPGDVVRVYADRRIPHYELGDLHRACDMVALPYRKITTSAAYFMAITLDRPVLAPDLPFFRLHTGEEKHVAFLYDHAGGTEAIRACLAALAKDGFPEDPPAFRKIKELYTWRKAAAAIAPAFDALVKPGA
jgi:glycosyltransferase involved in cell wall biosynthesis